MVGEREKMERKERGLRQEVCGGGGWWYVLVVGG